MNGSGLGCAEATTETRYFVSVGTSGLAAALLVQEAAGMQNVELYLNGTLDELRMVADRLEVALGADGAVLPFFGKADLPAAEKRDAQFTISVQGVANQEEALERLQPAVRLADPELKVVTGGTLTVRQVRPAPPAPGR